MSEEKIKLIEALAEECEAANDQVSPYGCDVHMIMDDGGTILGPNPEMWESPAIIDMIRRFAVDMRANYGDDIISRGSVVIMRLPAVEMGTIVVKDLAVVCPDTFRTGIVTQLYYASSYGWHIKGHSRNWDKVVEWMGEELYFELFGDEYGEPDRHPHMSPSGTLCLSRRSKGKAFSHMKYLEYEAALMELIGLTNSYNRHDSYTVIPVKCAITGEPSDDVGQCQICDRDVDKKLMVRCPRCGIWRCIDNANCSIRDDTSDPGELRTISRLTVKCKSCFPTANNGSRSIKDAGPMKYCRKCKNYRGLLPLSEFRAHGGTFDGYEGVCKKCRKG